MNSKIATIFVTSIALAACSTGGTQPATSRPTNPVAATPTPNPTTPAAASPTAPPTSGGGSVSGRQFLSVNVTTGGEPHPLAAGTRIRLTCEDGNRSAQAGCTSIGGNYSIDDAKLIFSGGSMTEMACDEPRMAQDDWLIGILESGPSLMLDGDNLTLTAGDTTIVLLDSEVAEPDQPLTGKTWTLTSLVSADSVSSVPAGVVAMLAFAEDGSVDVNPGCNSGGGTYSVDGDSIAFSDIITTKMACLGPAMEVENAVLQVLSSDGLTFSIDANTLTIKATDVGLQFTAS